MKEFFITSNSFAAPFFSDSREGFVKGKDAKGALLAYVSGYKHPAGLYSAAIYSSADAYHHNEKPLFRWLCNHELAKAKATAKLGSYSFLGHAPGKFEINGKMIEVENPKGGEIVDAA
jgi:hypothetical protein